MTEIAGILKLHSKYQYGTNKKGIEYFLFTSINPDIKEQFLVASSLKKKYSENIYVTVAILNKPLKKFEKYRYAMLKRIIGNVSNIDNKYEILFHKYCFNIKKQPIKMIETVYQRKDLTTLQTISIDPYGSRDIDDALSIIDENTVLIHIADPTSLIDIKNPFRYSTIYNHRVINMYNDQIGYDIGSLIKGAFRSAITFEYKISTNSIHNSFLSNVIVDENYSYKNESDDIIQLKTCFSMDDTHQIIEKLMVAINNYTGSKLVTYGVGIFRNYHIKDINAFIDDEDLLEILTIVKGNSAEYSLQPQKHDFLKIENYCHFTSPLRRYVDSINHLLWKKYEYGIESVVESAIESVNIPVINSELIENINLFEKKHRRLTRDGNRLKIQQLIGDEIISTSAVVVDFYDKEKHKITIYIEKFKILASAYLIEKELLSLYDITYDDNSVTLSHKTDNMKYGFILYDYIFVNLYNKSGKLIIEPS